MIVTPPQGDPVRMDVSPTKVDPSRVSKKKLIHAYFKVCRQLEEVKHKNREMGEAMGFIIPMLDEEQEKKLEAWFNERGGADGT